MNITNSSTLNIRHRQTFGGPEFELINAALENGFPNDTRLQRLLFREPELPTGFPDLVLVYFGRSPVNFAPSRVHLTHQHIRLLHHLYSVRRSDVRNLSSTLALKERLVRTFVDDLINSSLVSLRGKTITSKSLPTIFAARRIVAVEAKVKDWRKALHQAAANMWFASHSFILLPRHRRLSFITEEAQKIGVGVLVYDGEATKVVIKAKKNNIPASYGSWLFNEWTIRHLQTEAR